VTIGADDLAALAARVGPTGDVLAVDESVDVLEELRGGSRAPNVFYLLGSADVLPLTDASVDEVSVRSLATTEAAEEFFRVLRSGGRLAIAGTNGSTLNSDERMVTEAGFVDVSGQRGGGGGSLSARKP
jgi:ubiquinone/menaquinone biosynthesis C-methylase UbiE